MPQLLLELFSEEIPSAMQVRAASDLKVQVEARLSELGVKYTSVEAYATPRRLTLVAEGLPSKQKDSKEERRGPRTDAPEQAVKGFVKSVGLEESQLEKRQTAKGEFYFAVIEQKGRSIADVLAENLQDIICGFTWPKSMKWGNHGIRWVRPLHNILCVFDGKTLELTFGHLKANDETYGHRFMHPEAFNVVDFYDYKEKLKHASVILDMQERKQLIHADAEKQAKAYGLLVKKDEALLQEVAGLVEWPEVLIGNIEKRFMDLPPEVLITAMRSHQKYFSLHTSDGRMAPHFITVANIKTKDKGAKIIHGNERVLKARLEDAKFFWDQDRHNALESKLPDLEKIVFHAKLGTVAQKTARIEALAKLFAVWIPHANLVLVERAARLCKVDLTTEMVGEFPELQGLMGSYYALESKEDPQVADAIKEHYSPLGPGDMCPFAPLSVAVALADKIDTLVGLFAIDEKPTGSRDPYALRRAALGVIRIIVENKLRVPLRLLFEKSINRYPKSLFKAQKSEKKMIVLAKSEKQGNKQDQVMFDLLQFFIDRFRVLLRDKDVRYDLIEAVFDDGSEDDLNRLLVRVKALEEFLQTDDGENLCAAYKRANNIVVAEEKKDDRVYNGLPNKDLLTEPEEVELYRLFKEIKPEVSKHIKKDQFAEVMAELAKLRGPIDEFFEKVTVNSSNKAIRRNRLLLLSQFRDSLNQVANFSKIEG